jgi:hypothetical protein
VQSRRAITLLKVVCLLVLVAVAAGFLFPAVCKVRHAAARSTCSNNLKQLGVAVHNYASANDDRMPPGTVAGTSLPVEQRLSFNALLLPYLECSDVYRKLAQDEPWDSPRNAEAVSNYQTKVFRCPGLLQARQSEPPWDGNAPTNYIGVAGIGLDAASLPLDDPRIGMLGYERQLRITAVKDGTENTILMMESDRDPGPWIRGGPSTLRGIDIADRPITGENRAFGGTHRPSDTFFSKRPTGSNILLADGSVRYTNDTIDPDVLAGLATAAGGESVPADW